MNGKYSLLQDYITKHAYKQVLYEAIQTIKTRIAGHKQVISRTELLLHEDESRLQKTDDSYDRVSRELRELEHLLCDNNEGKGK
jgi:uncharacterized protein (DUF3084 family)